MRRSGRSVENDPGVQALLDSAADAVTFVAKSWDYHVDVALGIPRAENRGSSLKIGIFHAFLADFRVFWPKIGHFREKSRFQA